ncbi:prolyl oligopeptidase family serine peptidase [Streptomyces sp. V4-01]|uniref:Prolyl oligopeptidase family serine peptidase n=1 Tax=Actinacidiphila polyblastidii TaxID=3110430 RepID=A0ABU7PKQ2_9ACTN|nr:prolyl oligopeptidase family serine peptidase [Streptomyces sp. V4-01]
MDKITSGTQDSPDRRDRPRSPDHRGFPRQFARTRRFALGVPRAFTLTPEGDGVLFLRTRGAEDPVSCLWRRDAGGERLLADPADLAGGAPAELPEAERVRRERAREHTSGIVGYATDAAVRLVVLTLDAALWTCDPGTGRTRRVPTAGPVVDPRPDPSGRRVAYVTAGALHVVELDSGADRTLAAPEGPEVTYGLAEHVAAESMGRRRGHWWAPDGERLLVARVDTSPVRRWWIADPADPARPPREVPYPAAGTANADVSLHVLGLDGARTAIDWDRTAYEYVTAAHWDAHGPLVGVQSRDQRTVRVLDCDPGSGATRVLHEQRDPAWVQLIPGTPVRTASGALVHTADEGDTRRLTVDGRPVTPEGLQIREVVGVEGESVLFVASDEPTEAHLWSYDPARRPVGAGGPLVRLSEGPGVHAGQRAGAGLLLASHTEGGQEFRFSSGGRSLPVANLAAEPLVRPRPVWLRAGERALRTALLLPSWYEPGVGPLPVLLAPYGGPAMQLAVRARSGPLCQAQWFAEEGFAVVVADGRGTPGRGPRWEKTVHGDTLTAPVEDQVRALHAAASHCPDLDLTRVAIRGWSFGGSLAAMAVLRRPDVFHAAVCGAGPSDQRLYDTHWRERFLGHPDEDPAAYERSSPISEAASLSRPLLLVHGLADDNVVAAHTLRMSAALLAAGRPHQVLPLSRVTHSPSDEVVVEGLMRHEVDFLRTALNAAAP